MRVFSVCPRLIFIIAFLTSLVFSTSAGFSLNINTCQATHALTNVSACGVTLNTINEYFALNKSLNSLEACLTTGWMEPDKEYAYEKIIFINCD